MPNGTRLPHSDNTSPPLLVLILGALGLLPIVLLTLLLVSLGDQSNFWVPLVDAIKTYSAIVISFVGGIHWATILGGLKTSTAHRGISISMVAPFFGWLAIFLNEPMSFALLIVCLLAQGAWENLSVINNHLPPWHSKVRQILTMFSVVSLAVAMFATA